MSRRLYLPVYLPVVGSVLLCAFLYGCGGDTANLPQNGGFVPASTALTAAGIPLAGGGTTPGTFRNAAIPTNGTAPAPTVSSSGTVVRGGSLLLTVTTPQPASDILVAVQGQPGYYDITVPAAGRSVAVVTPPQTAWAPGPPKASASVTVSRNAGSVIYQIVLSISPNTTVSQLILQVAYMANGVLSAIATQTVHVDTVAQTSNFLQVSINWSAPVDIDLHVKTPDGTEIGYDNRTGQNGGTLDRDSNAACSIDNIDNENITWLTQAPASGTYVIRPDLWANCGQPGPFPYVITVNNAGHQQTFTGSFNASEQDSNSSDPTAPSFSHTITIAVGASSGGGSAGSYAGEYRGTWAAHGANEGGGVFDVRADFTGHVTGTVTQEIGGSQVYSVSGTVTNSGAISFASVTSGQVGLTFNGTITGSSGHYSASGSDTLAVDLTQETGPWQTTSFTPVS